MGNTTFSEKDMLDFLEFFSNDVQEVVPKNRKKTKLKVKNQHYFDTKEQVLQHWVVFERQILVDSNCD